MACGGWRLSCRSLSAPPPVRAKLVEAMAPPPSVRAELVEARACRLERHACVEGGGRESPGMRVTFFRVAERKSPKKGRPPVCDPCASLRGKPASERLRGAPWNSLRAARYVQTATASQITRHGRSDAHAHPATAPPQAQPAGVGEPNSRIAKHPNSHAGRRVARPRSGSAGLGLA